MAQDRLFHKRLGHSEKVNRLTDFEYIVWGCYILSADDYGVMRAAAVTLQADHDRLTEKPQKAVQGALETIIDIGLIVPFEHQGRRYVCQPDWQDFQKVRYPGQSHNPVPPPEVLDRCTAPTRKLFDLHSEPFSPKSEKTSVRGSDLPHGDVNVHVNENGDGADRNSGAPSGTPAVQRKQTNNVDERFSAFWRAYPRKTAKDGALKIWRKLQPTAETLDQIIAALGWQTRSEQWLKDNGQYVPLPTTYLNQGRWKDEPPSAASDSRPRGCNHIPQCEDAVAHTKRYLSEQKAS
jgi:hypothetical protein